MMYNNGVIMSVPPIINNQHIKMILNTHNSLLDAIWLDYIKKPLIAMLSFYSNKPFIVEEVKVFKQQVKKKYIQI